MENFWDEVRERARSQAFDKAKKSIELRRLSERKLRKRGLGGPFDDINLRDVERLRKSGEYSILAEQPEFVERVRMLEGEMAHALDEVREAEDAAVLTAMEDIPDEVQLAEKHRSERAILLQQAGVDDIDDALPEVKERYNELLGRQRVELESQS